MAKTQDITQIWDSLGTFWGKFTEKELLENIWDSYYTLSNGLLRNNFRLRLSKSLKYMPELFQHDSESFYITLSGQGQNIADQNASVSGLASDEFAFKLPYDNIATIPTLTNLVTNEDLVENTHYRIENNNYLIFNTDNITIDPADKPLSYTAKVHAEKILTYNIVLWNIWAKNLGLTLTNLKNEDYIPYILGYDSQSGETRLESISAHFKFLIWGLTYLRALSTTILSLERGIGISAGIPFVYRPGKVSAIDGRVITVLTDEATGETDAYKIPGSTVNLAVSTGQDVEAFDLLTEGMSVWDYVNKPLYIESLATSDFDKRNIVVFNRDPSLSGMEYNKDFYKEYAINSAPKSFKVYFTEYHQVSTGVSNIYSLGREYPMTYDLDHTSSPDYAYINSLDFNSLYKNSFTIAAWVKPDMREVTTVDFDHMQSSSTLGIHYSPAIGESYKFDFGILGGAAKIANSNDAGKFYCDYDVTTSATNRSANRIKTSSPVVAANNQAENYIFLVAVFDFSGHTGETNIVRLYVNGVQQQVNTYYSTSPMFDASLYSTTNPLNFNIPNNESLYTGIGSKSMLLKEMEAEWTNTRWEYNRYQGLIDEIAAWNTVLTSAEVSSIYNGGIPADLSLNFINYNKAENLKAWWRFEEGSGTSIADSAGNSNAILIVNGTLSELKFNTDIPEAVL